MSQVEIEKARFPWIQLILFTAVIGFIENVWIAFQPGGAYHHFFILGIVACPLQLTGGPFIVLFASIILSKVPSLRKWFNLRSVVLLWIVTVCASWFTDYAANMEWYGEIFLGRVINPELSVQYVPSFMAPTEGVVNQLVSGGYSVPWGEWVPTIFFWWALSAIFGMLMASAAIILRRGWTDIEILPFPHVTATYEVLSNASDLTPSSKDKASRMRPFLIGILLGFVAEIPIWGQGLFPWFPDLYGWRTNTCSHGGGWIPSESPLAQIAGLSIYQKHPVFIAIGYFAPLSVLFSTWFFYLVFLILMQVAYIMGYYTGIIEMAGCGRSWCGTTTSNYGEPFKFMSLSYVGGSMALTLIYFVMNRRYLLETLRAAFGRMDAEAKLKLEEKEVMSYRTAYMIFAVFFVLATIIMMSVGLGVAAAVTMPISVFIFWIADARIWGQAGATLQGAEHGQALYKLFFWDQAPDPPTREYMLSGYFSEWMVDVPKAFGGAMLSSFAAFRMAKLCDLNNRDVFKALIVGIVVAPLSVLVTFVWLNNTFGLTRLAVFNDQFTDSLIDRTGNPENWNVRPGTTPWIPNMLVGMIIVGGLYFLHARFIWFPLEPIGFIFGMSYMSLLWGIWFPFLIAWILKTLTLRLGGTKTFESFGVPVAAGFIAGFMVIVLFGGITGIIKFFVPF